MKILLNVNRKFIKDLLSGWTEPVQLHIEEAADGSFDMHLRTSAPRPEEKGDALA